jgi:hypothetical protein
MAVVLFAATTLVLGSWVAVVAKDEEISPIAQVMGRFEVAWQPGGTFDVRDRVFQYRGFLVGGSTGDLTDPRLAGQVEADRSWDVAASGDQPMPARGTMTIDAADGSWDGTFTGIRHGDLDDVAVRAFLFGTGSFEGLCATLDIAASDMAGPSTWIVDGVVHPVPMAG